MKSLTGWQQLLPEGRFGVAGKQSQQVPLREDTRQIVFFGYQNGSYFFGRHRLDGVEEGFLYVDHSGARGDPVFDIVLHSWFAHGYLNPICLDLSTNTSYPGQETNHTRSGKNKPSDSVWGGTGEPRMSEVKILPNDQHNRTLVGHVHPPDWQNPEPVGRYNLVVIGAGTAGLIAANGAAGLGAKVALVEKHLMGGDCLNVGCVPSKGLIRSARAAAEVRDAAEFGVISGGYKVDFPGCDGTDAPIAGGNQPGGFCAALQGTGRRRVLGGGCLQRTGYG